MGADGVAIAFVTPEQGRQLTAIESFVNLELEKTAFEGFDAFKTRPAEADEIPLAPRPVVPIFGRRIRRYSNRL
jgi:superfamily II DNA/RNA helicase